MARSRIPDPLSRRHLIEKELPADQALAIAEAYLAEDRLAESIIFLVKADAEEGLRELRDRAIEEGDGFLLSEIGRIARLEIEPEAWARLEASARSAGKLRYAEDGQRLAQRGDD